MKEFSAGQVDIAVIGAGHAGIEAALAAAVRDMEAMALTIRRRTDHDTECCSFCHYAGPAEDYCPGWEGEECFQWRGK